MTRLIDRDGKLHLPDPTIPGHAHKLYCECDGENISCIFWPKPMERHLRLALKRFGLMGYLTDTVVRLPDGKEFHIEQDTESEPKDRADRISILKRLVPYVEDSDAGCTTPASLCLAIWTRVDREENIKRVEESGSWPHCKQAAIDFYNGARRWLPVTEAHWHFWNGVVPPRLVRHDIVLTGEEFTGNLAYAVYRREAGFPDTTYWCALLTPGEVSKGDVRLTLPYATELPTFNDIAKP
jgi:hypothetical protein